MASEDPLRSAVKARLLKAYSQEAVEEVLELADATGRAARPDPEVSLRLTLVIAPFLEGDEDLYTIEMLSALAVNAWNVTLMPRDEEGPFLEFLLRMIPNEEPTFLCELSSELCGVKRQMFPDDMRFIADCRVKQIGDAFEITALTAPGYMDGPAVRQDTPRP